MNDWSTLQRLIWLRAMIGGGTAATVTGVSPLSLVNAIAKPIKSLIQYGKCSIVDGDIYCNNGKLVAVDDELPSGYKRLLGITFDGNFRYETGEALTGDDDVTMTLENLSSGGKNLFGSYNGANDKNFSLYIYGSSSSGSYFRYGDQLKRPKYGTGKRTITFGKSGTTGFTEDSTVTPDEFTTPANVCIGMLPNSSSPAYTGDVIGSIIVSNRLEWIPCENPSGVIGYYEKYNGNFIAPSGDGTPASLGYDTSHQTAPSVVGTPEVLTVMGKNLIDSGAYWTDGTVAGVSYTRNADGSIHLNGTSTNNYTNRSIYPADQRWIIPVGTYIASGGTANAQLRLNTYKEDGTLISRVQVKDTPQIVNVTDETGYIVVVVGYVSEGSTADDTIYPQLELGTTASEYEQYAPQTATVANLFSDGTAHDEQDIISGTVTRRTAVSVSSGVITISALPSPVTEHVTAQPLRTADGSNTVSVTSNVDPVELSVNYVASS